MSFHDIWPRRLRKMQDKLSSVKIFKVINKVQIDCNVEHRGDTYRYLQNRFFNLYITPSLSTIEIKHTHTSAITFLHDSCAMCFQYSE